MQAPGDLHEGNFRFGKEGQLNLVDVRRHGLGLERIPEMETSRLQIPNGILQVVGSTWPGFRERKNLWECPDVLGHSDGMDHSLRGCYIPL